MNESIASFREWLAPLIAAAGSVAFALLLHWVVFRILGRLVRRPGSPIGPGRLARLGHPVRWILVLFALRLVIDPIVLADQIEGFLQTLFGLLLTGLIAWLLLSAAGVLHVTFAHRFKVDVEDNLQARKVHTQLEVIHRIAVVLILLFSLAAMLMVFPKVRQLGTALFASAGLLGIVVGLAAQKTIATFIAGLQIAFTQPIRIDDVLIVEGEWGRVEEITLTYVVLRVWDLRRLVVPITYFIEKPFQNWTRTSASIFGTVFLYVDPAVAVGEVRAELKRIVEASPLWDRKVCGLQVTNVTERTIELRALVSTADASKAWDLRCEVREKLIEFLRTRQPQALPRFRAVLERGARPTPEATGSAS